MGVPGHCPLHNQEGTQCQVCIPLACSRAVAEVPSKEAQGVVCLLCCVADVGAPLEVDGEQDAEIGVVLDLLEDGVVQGVVEEDS